MSDNPPPSPAPDKHVFARAISVPPFEGRGFQPPSHIDPKIERESQTARTIAILFDEGTEVLVPPDAAVTRSSYLEKWGGP